MAASWRYFGGTSVDISSNSLLAAPPVPPTDARLNSVSYLDLSANIPFHDSILLRVGVNNLLDEDPPLAGFSNCPALYCFSQVYDTLGRQLFVALSANF